jgi:hypothetical protein
VLPAKLPPSSSYCLPWHRGAHQQYVASRSPSQTILARPGRLLFFKFQPVGARPLTTLHQPPRTTHPATLHGDWQRRPTAPIDLAVLLTATQDLSVTRPRPCTQRFFIRSSAAADTRTARGTEPPTNPASQAAPETRRAHPPRGEPGCCFCSSAVPGRRISSGSRARGSGRGAVPPANAIGVGRRWGPSTRAGAAGG